MDYTNLYDFQTSTGIIVPDDSSVLLGIQKKFQEIFGTDIDLSAETPVGRLIEAFSVVVKSTLGVTAQTANQFNVNEATGIYLDAIAQIYDLKRIAGTKTKITVKCYFSDGGIRPNKIPAGSLVMCSATSDLFRLDTDVSNESAQVEEETGRYYAVGTATAVDTGPVTAPIGTVNSIQTAVVGWTGVTNIAPTYTGTDIETDDAFRKRIIASRPTGVGFNTHLVSSLNRLNGVYSNCILENNTGTDAVKKGVVIPPHSVFIAVDCIETEGLLDEIAEEISKAKPVGVGMVHSGVPIDGLISRTVGHGYENGYAQTIHFYKAKKTAVHVSVSYSYGKYSGEDIARDIATTVSEYVDTIGTGGVVYGTMIANELISKLNIGIGSVWVQKDGSKIPADYSVEMTGYETPYSIADNITISEIQ